jgi:hypothetical protein
MKIEDVALARLRSDLLDTLWLKYPQALSLDQLEADVRVAYLTRLLMRQATPDWKWEQLGRAGAIREQLAVLNNAWARQVQHQGVHVDREGETGSPTGSPVPGHQQPTHATTRGSMTTFFVCWFVLACLALVINYLIHHNG